MNDHTLTEENAITLLSAYEKLLFGARNSYLLSPDDVRLLEKAIAASPGNQSLVFKLNYRLVFEALKKAESPKTTIHCVATFSQNHNTHQRSFSGESEDEITEQINAYIEKTGATYLSSRNQKPEVKRP